MRLTYRAARLLSTFPSDSRGVKRQIVNKSLPSKTYFPKGLTQNNHGFQCSLAQTKNRYPLSGLFREKTVKNLHGWTSCLALTAPTLRSACIQKDSACDFFVCAHVCHVIHRWKEQTENCWSQL